MSDQPMCEVCGKYEARVFHPSFAMWCHTCDLMGLGGLAVREKVAEQAEALGRQLDELAPYMFGDAPAATEAGDPEAWADPTHLMPEPVRQLADLAHQLAAGDDGVAAQAQVWLDETLPQVLGKAKVDSLDDADKAYVWADRTGAHWGWLEGSGWVAWSTGVAPWQRGAVGPFVMFCSNDGFSPRITLTCNDAEAGEPVEQTPVDMVAHPSHYTSSPAKCSACGHPIECIDITQHMGFCLGNATKYVWRCDLKHDAIEDLRKAIQYIEFEIARREALADTTKG
ncbi:hypothetical protein PBI_VALIDUS_56 [Mycobacterium phage Validus]|uniref:Uncharacterized protein n=1 Tax=Mycobacterium phage Validus TaxID=1414747 RepID=V5UPX4_9CAUD|nr:hypothetical protein CC50_gp055 [Mycobacterium phage Validus]AHB79586.1 hypothetical protein PBI_VALIDUS_56 [Mycobacterium phage Validus]